MSGDERAVLAEAFMAEVRRGLMAGDVITRVCQSHRADPSVVVAAMWELVEDGRLEYDTGARIRPTATNANDV